MRVSSAIMRNTRLQFDLQPGLFGVTDHSDVLFYVVQPFRFARSSIPKQNRSHDVNVICDRSPSRMRMVLLISLGMTTLPRSSILRTIPVAFIVRFLLRFSFSRQKIVSAKTGTVCKNRPGLALEIHSSFCAHKNFFRANRRAGAISFIDRVSYILYNKK